VIDTGAPITVPVGRARFGRIFNLLGEPIDGGVPMEGRPSCGWPIHRDAPTIEASMPDDGDVRDGIKVVDLLAPYAKGGKGRAVSAVPVSVRPSSFRS